MIKLIVLSIAFAFLANAQQQNLMGTVSQNGNTLITIPITPIPVQIAQEYSPTGGPVSINGLFLSLKLSDPASTVAIITMGVELVNGEREICSIQVPVNQEGSWTSTNLVTSRAVTSIYSLKLLAGVETLWNASPSKPSSSCHTDRP